MRVFNLLCLGCNLVLPVISQYISSSSSKFDVKLNSSTQTLASLLPLLLPSFDFSPFDVLAERSANGNYHTGDLALRWREVGDLLWNNADSSTNRVPVTILPAEGNVFAASDLSSTFPEIPLNVTRSWAFEGGDVTLSFNLTNSGNNDIEIGGLGFPIEFNSIFTGRTAEEFTARCSLTDPYIGLDGGYLRVTPLSGTGPALVVTPLGKSPFEAWRFLSEDTSTPLGYQSQTFEGLYSWEVVSKAYAENEWNAADPWNPSTSLVISPRDTITVGLRLSVAENIQSIGSAVQETGTPFAVGIPGYVIPQDLDAELVLYYNSTVSTISSVPQGAFRITPSGTKSYSLSANASAWGRVRVDIVYSNNVTQTVHYYIIKSAPQALSDLGNFLTTSQYYTNTSDPFHRAPSVISYDRQVNDFVTQDPRVWIAGLSDEGGAGSWLAASMKQAFQPNAAEVSKMEDYIHQTLWGTLENPDYSVKKSVFFYQPSVTNYSYDTNIDWTNWWSWDLADAFGTSRTYDYVHVTAAYWALYRVARSYPSLTTKADWSWYLNQSYQTVAYSMSDDSSGNPVTGYTTVGLMGETVFGYLLQDLQRENLTSETSNLEAIMKRRAELWASQSIPYGSEMAWDSTGEEGVYYWSSYFNLTSTATKTIDAVLGYMPTVSHWGWNGNARRYWDFIYAGKLQRLERQVHHYGSSLNALPLLSNFERNPTDAQAQYGLQVGLGGNWGPLSNIDEGGFASAAFHSWPDTLAWDGYSGDYGPNLLGVVLGSGCYVLDDPDLGLVAFGGTITTTPTSSSAGTSTVVAVEPRDVTRRKIYLAPYGLRFSLDSGAFESIRYTSGTTGQNSSISIVVAPSISTLPEMPKASSSVLWIERIAQVGTWSVLDVGGNLPQVREGWGVDFTGNTGSVTVTISLS